MEVQLDTVRFRCPRPCTMLPTANLVEIRVVCLMPLPASQQLPFAPLLILSQRRNPPLLYLLVKQPAHTLLLLSLCRLLRLELPLALLQENGTLAHSRFMLFDIKVNLHTGNPKCR